MKLARWQKLVRSNVPLSAIRKIDTVTDTLVKLKSGRYSSQLGNVGKILKTGEWAVF